MNKINFNQRFLSKDIELNELTTKSIKKKKKKEKLMDQIKNKTISIWSSSVLHWQPNLV